MIDYGYRIFEDFRSRLRSTPGAGMRSGAIAPRMGASRIASPQLVRHSIRPPKLKPAGLGSKIVAPIKKPSFITNHKPTY